MDPSDRDQNDPGNAAPGGEEPTRTIGEPGEDDSWLRFVVQNSSEIVEVVDPDGTLRYASPAFGLLTLQNGGTLSPKTSPETPKCGHLAYGQSFRAHLHLRWQLF